MASEIESKGFLFFYLMSVFVEKSTISISLRVNSGSQNG